MTGIGTPPRIESRGERDAASSGGLGLFELPAHAVRTVARSSRTSPGKLAIIMAALVAFALFTGLVATTMVQDKRDTVTNIAEHREPLAAAGQQVYRALSDADATAANAFLAIGREPPHLRERYEDDVAQAGVALARAAADVRSMEAAEQVDVISKQLPVYTGLVETARANNLQGYPVGASYLREASELMRSKILPAAEELYRIDTDRVVERQDAARAFPWFTAVTVVALLAALWWTQRYLRRKTNRVINVGLMVATVAVAVGLVWATIALVVQGVMVKAGQRDGTEQVDLLVESRIAALKARADETLALIARGGGAAHWESYDELMTHLAGDDGADGWLDELADGANGAIADHVADAQDSVEVWRVVHEEIKELDSGGDHSDAIELAIDTDNDEGAAVVFAQVDDSLREAILAGRQSFHDDTTTAARALTLLAPGVAVLGVIAALGVAVGVRERLREYQ